MSGLPNVDITVQNGQLGLVDANEDAVMGLVVSGVAATGLAISTPKQVFSLEEVEALGIDAAYDTTNTTDVYKQISDFYSRAGNGIELWFMIIPKTTTMANACDKANDVVKKLLNAAQGRIKMWGITRVADGAYTPVTTDGIDNDVAAAVAKANELNESFSDAFKYCRSIVGARLFQGTPSSLKDFSALAYNRVGVMLGSVVPGGNPAVGFLLGQFANRPVQRKISRVKDGALGISAAYLSNGTAIETYEGSWDAIADKGYIFFRTFANKTGYYFTSDPACCSPTDDYSSLARGRVMDKALRIVYNTFTEELEDDIEIDEDGYMDPSVVKDYQQKIINAISEAMLPGEISGVRVVMDPKQNLLSSETVAIEEIKIRPKGYSKWITASVGFDNPLNQ